MLNEIELDHNAAAEATKNFCCAKGESETGHCTVTRWFKKFRAVFKKLDDQVRSDRPTTVDYKTVLTKK